ncbi:MAG: hypothetical protein AB8I08_24680 [Sandaracinaceae bacterium]
MKREAKAILIGAVMVLAACGGDSIECGAGTVEADGVCVPTGTDIMCGAGTVLDMTTGSCVPEGELTTCAAGTTRNAMTGACEPDVECGTGTSPMGGECVPDGTVICADGTMFDMDTGTCVPNDDLATCAEGTTLIDGECVPDDETLMGETFAAAEPDDPTFDGTPATFIPPAVGMEVTAEGCITAADFDMDGEIDVDRDVFSFAVSAPGLYRINVDGLGGLAAAFFVAPDDGPLFDQNWLRFGLNYAGDTSERQVYLPRAGNYSIFVFDARSFDVDSGFGPPVGNTETCYFMTVEALEVPTATPITDDMATGTLGAPQFFSATSVGRQSLTVRLFESQPAAVAGLVIDRAGDVLTNASAAGFMEDQAYNFSPGLNADETLLIVVDTVYSLTTEDIPWRLQLERSAEIPNEGTLTFNNDPDAFELGFIDLMAGDVVRFRATSDSGDALAMSIIEPGRAGFHQLCDACTDADEYFVVGTTGTHAFQVVNTVADEGMDFDVTFDIDTQTPPALTADTAMTVTFVDGKTFVRVDTSSLVWTRYDLTDYMGATFDGLHFGIHEIESGILDDPPADETLNLADTLSRIDGIEFGGPLLIELEEPDSFDGDESVSVTFGSETFTDVTGDPAAPFMASGVAVSDTESAYYFVRGLPGGNLTVEVTPAAGTDAALYLLDGNAERFVTVDGIAPDAVESLTRAVGADGWFAFEVGAVAAGMVDITITQGLPPYTQAPGSTAFASICPDLGGAGVNVPFATGGLDEGTTGIVDFTTFSGFEYYGVPVSNFQISSNGFISFSATELAGAFFAPVFFLHVPVEPTSVIAAYWYDLANDRVCMLEEAGRFIVEWAGVALDLNDFTVALGSVETQVILTAATGTVEIVFGPNHQLGRNPQAFSNFTEGAVGLKNGDGSFIATPFEEPAPDVSTLFTPGM